MEGAWILTRHVPRVILQSMRLKGEEVSQQVDKKNAAKGESYLNAKICIVGAGRIEATAAWHAI